MAGIRNKFSVTTDEIFSQALSPGAKVLFIRLCGYYSVKRTDLESELWDKSLGMLALATGTHSDGTVRRWLRELQASDLIDYTLRPGRSPYIIVYPLKREPGRRTIIIPNVVLALPSVSPNAKLFYGLVRSFGGLKPTGCYAKRTTLAERMGCAGTTIGKFKQELMSADLMRPEVTSGRNAEGRFFKQTRLFLCPEPTPGFAASTNRGSVFAPRGIDPIARPPQSHPPDPGQIVEEPPPKHSYRDDLLDDSLDDPSKDIYSTGIPRSECNSFFQGKASPTAEKGAVTDPETLRAQKIIEVKRRRIAMEERRDAESATGRIRRIHDEFSQGVYGPQAGRRRRQA